jgi:hypothetical protein
MGLAIREYQRADGLAILEHLDALRQRFQVGGAQRLLDEQTQREQGGGEPNG